MNPRAVLLAVVAVVVAVGGAMFLRSPSGPAASPPPSSAPLPSAGAPPAAPPGEGARNSSIPFERARSATRPTSPAAASEPSPKVPAPSDRDGDRDDPVEPSDEPDDSDPGDDEGELRTIWSVDKEGLDGAVREALPELRECYEEWLKLDPDIAGELLLKFAVGVPLDGEAAEDGTPLAAITELRLANTTVGHSMMEGCALNVFSDLWFSPPEDGPIWVSYPVVLDNR